MGGYNKTVTLNATGVPDNVAVSFSPAGGVPDFGSTMTIKVGVNATLWDVTITVRGSDVDGLEKSDTFILRITG